MSTNICNEVYADPALAYVDLGWTTFQKYAFDSYQMAVAQVDGLNGFEIPFHTWDASFSATGELSGFNRPTRPDLIPIAVQDLSTAVPDAPTVTLGPLTIEAAPVEPTALASPPEFMIPAAPGELSAARPGAAPVMTLPTLPDAPVLVDPDAPLLVEVTLPDVPDVTITTFDEIAPIFDAPVPSEHLEFNEQAYVSSLLDQTKAQVAAMMSGEYYLPEAVARALWDRAVSRDDASALKLEQGAREQFSTRGFDQPNGILAGQLFEVRQANRGKRSELNREVYIQEETVAVENLKFAVQQGIQLETTMLQAHLTIEGRRFDLAVKIKDVAVAVFNARVTQYNAVVSAYNARIEAYKAYLDGLRAEVDIYRAQVDAAKVKGEINEQRVRAYAEQIRAQLARAEMYRAQIEGFKATVDAERAKIEGFSAEVDAYRGVVDAYGTEWNAYKTRLEGEAEKGKMYETLARVYGSRVEVFQTKAQVRIAEHQANQQANDALLRQHEAQIKSVLARLETVRAVIAGQTAQNEASARMYEADARIESTAVDADSRAFDAQTKRSETAVTLALRDAEMQLSQLSTRTGLLLRAMESGSQASSQLASSAFSAMNFSAGVSSSQSRNKACSTSFNYSGEIADA